MKVIKNFEDNVIEAFSIQYVNSIGAIIDNSLLLHNNESPMIKIDAIRKAEIHKKNNIKYNLLFFTLTLPFIYTLFAFNLTNIEKLLICAYILVLLGLAFFFKKPKYIIFFRKINADDIDFEINKDSKEDAKNMVRYINRRIKQLKGRG